MSETLPQPFSRTGRRRVIELSIRSVKDGQQTPRKNESLTVREQS